MSARKQLWTRWQNKSICTSSPTFLWAEHAVQRWSIGRGKWESSWTTGRRASGRADRCSCCCKRFWSRQVWGQGSADRAESTDAPTGSPPGKAHRTEWLHRTPAHHHTNNTPIIRTVQSNTSNSLEQIFKLFIQSSKRQAVHNEHLL